jgi:hypothetical protein
VNRIALCAGLALLSAFDGNVGGAEHDCADGRVYSVEEAVAERPWGVIQVEGFLLSRDGETSLCSALLESYPPQCGTPSLPVPGAPPKGGLTESAHGVTWSNDERRILGSLRRNTLLRVGCV